MEDDVRPALGTATLLEEVFGIALAAPVDGLSTFAVGEGLDLYARGYHKGGVEAQAKVSDDGDLVILVLIQELFSPREGNLIDVLLYFFGGQPNASVADGDGLGFCIEADGDLEVAKLALELSCGGQCAELL